MGDMSEIIVNQLTGEYNNIAHLCQRIFDAVGLACACFFGDGQRRLRLSEAPEFFWSAERSNKFDVPSGGFGSLSGDRLCGKGDGIGQPQGAGIERFSGNDTHHTRRLEGQQIANVIQ